ncbi:MAG: hypothetical protein J1E42_07260 [Akkermansiaceae bacterium]|nr:hypothetical protein [Akkermansiaceae bacterium]
MKSLILTLLYLAKDTIHRWMTRISSPLARVLVVFFLSLCALAALGGYVISAKAVRNSIIERGGNIVVTILSLDEGNTFFLPPQEFIEQEFHADSYLFSNAGMATLPDGKAVRLLLCDFSRLQTVMPFLGSASMPTLVQDGDKINLPQGPSEAQLGNRLGRMDIQVRTLPPKHPLGRILDGGAIIVQKEFLDHMQVSATFGQRTLAICTRDLESSAPVRRVESFLRTLQRLEGVYGQIISALPLLQELDLVLGKQTQCRIAFCLGISGIVGILLTALAGMEYRQNEYIYTLMKSFGIHPLLLVFSFIVENLLIVGASFAGALAVFMYFQRVIVKDILKMGNNTLSLLEIRPEIELICYTLLGCVLVSSIPIFVAANREIGRVLK